MPARVLLVEDNPAHRELFRVMFELDHDITLIGEAGDGTAGVDLARELRPDLILSDIEMPHLNGLDAVAHYRAAAPDAVVVLMSSRAPSDAHAQARDAGADAYIDKGTGVDNTLRILKDLLHHHSVVDLRATEPTVDTATPRDGPC